MINCNENETGNVKLDHIDKTYIDQDETNTKNMVCLG